MSLQAATLPASSSTSLFFRENRDEFISSKVVGKLIPVLSSCGWHGFSKVAFQPLPNPSPGKRGWEAALLRCLPSSKTGGWGKKDF